MGFLHYGRNDITSIKVTITNICNIGRITKVGHVESKVRSLRLKRSGVEKSHQVKKSKGLDLAALVEVTRYAYNQPSFVPYDRSATERRNLNELKNKRMGFLHYGRNDLKFDYI